MYQQRIKLSKFRIPKHLKLIFLACNTLAWLVNLFVGVLVYQNPLKALNDSENVKYVLLFSSVLTLIVFLISRFIQLIERISISRSN